MPRNLERRVEILFPVENESLKEKLKQLGLTVFPSEANYLFFKGPKDLFADCVKEGILIRDCSNYEGLTRGYYRIAVRKHKDNEKLVDALRRILE